MFAWLLIY